MLSRRRTTLLVLVVEIPPLVVLFAIFHSGANGVRACEADGYGGPGTLKWWPPGADCVGGFPSHHATEINSTFATIAIMALTVGLVAGALIDMHRHERAAVSRS